MSIEEIETKIGEENKLALEAIRNAQAGAGFQQRAELCAQAAIRFGKCAMLADLRIAMLAEKKGGQDDR